jgi:F420H(2)-dependent quinone reductase
VERFDGSYDAFSGTPVEVGAETYQARAVIIDGEDRDRLYAEQVKRFSTFGEYEAKTTRKIPLIALERVN